MKHLFIFLLTLFAFAQYAKAQENFVQHVEKNTRNGAAVNVYHSREIDLLVNGKVTSKDTVRVEKKKETTPQKDLTKQGNDSQKHKEDKNKDSATTKRTPENDADTPSIENRKKVLTRAYKVTGYRVQAFVGGNTRQDKLKAQQTGERIKAAYPEEPVYVHFYSPRWICRVGNYRSVEEATKMLQNIRKLGFRQASIVKGKITVQY